MVATFTTFSKFPGSETQVAAWDLRVSDVEEEVASEEEDASEAEDAEEEIAACGGGGVGEVDAGANRRGHAGAKKGSRHAQPVQD